MKKIADEITHLNSNYINFIAEIINVLNIPEEEEQVHMKCVEHILHWSVDGPVWSSEQIPMTATHDQMQENGILVDV